MRCPHGLGGATVDHVEVEEVDPIDEGPFVSASLFVSLPAANLPCGPEERPVSTAVALVGVAPPPRRCYDTVS